MPSIQRLLLDDTTLQQTKIATKNGPGLKMYFLLNMGIFHCYVSLPECRRRFFFFSVWLPGRSYLSFKKMPSIQRILLDDTTLQQTKIATKNGPGLKMYFLLNMGIFHCYLSLPEGTSFLTLMVFQRRLGIFGGLYYRIKLPVVIGILTSQEDPLLAKPFPSVGHPKR